MRAHDPATTKQVHDNDSVQIVLEAPEPVPGTRSILLYQPRRWDEIDDIYSTYPAAFTTGLVGLAGITVLSTFLNWPWWAAYPATVVLIFLPLVIGWNLRRRKTKLKGLFQLEQNTCQRVRLEADGTSWKLTTVERCRPRAAMWMLKAEILVDEATNELLTLVWYDYEEHEILRLDRHETPQLKLTRLHLNGHSL